VDFFLVRKQFLKLDNMLFSDESWELREVWNTMIYKELWKRRKTNLIYCITAELAGAWS